MQSAGVDIRPLREITGGADFNEVFLTDVFVPDTDVIGTPNEAGQSLGQRSETSG
jgi:3-oxochol-4-en-24-oyl-CoA dehydrogenase